MPKKNRISILVFVLIISVGYSQEKVKFFDRNWTPTNNKDSVNFFLQINYHNDTAIICKFYRAFGSMIKMETYRDSAFSIPHGLFAWYNDFGEVDSLGVMQNGQREGVWVFGYDEKFSPLNIKEYKKGGLVQKRIENINNDANNMNRNELKSFRPAFFPDGERKWIAYLTQSVNKNPLYSNIKRTDAFHITMSIEIDSTGGIVNVFPLKSGDIFSDSNAEKTIRRSSKWKPAIQNGIPSSYFYLQKIYFN